MQTLSDRVKSALLFSGKSQTELARACNITPTSVNNWVSGETKSMKYSTALPAARFLGVRVEWLAEGKGTMSDDQRQEPQPQPVDPGPHRSPIRPQTISEMLENLKEEIAPLPESLKGALAGLVTEYLNSPDAKTGKTVADAIERIIDKKT